MSPNENWIYQGRQYHQWFGHGTAPETDKESSASTDGGLFDPASLEKRIDYVANSLIGHIPRRDRQHSAATFDTTARQQLRTSIKAWSGRPELSRDAFRGKFLDPHTSDETVDNLRRAASGIAVARSHEDLKAAGENLATVVRRIGLDRWPRYLANAEQRALAAPSDGGTGIIVHMGTPGEADQFIPPRGGLPRDMPMQPGLPNLVPAARTTPNMSKIYVDNRAKQYCIDRCSTLALPTSDYGVSFQRCVLTCTGQSTFPEWLDYFP